MLNVLKATVPVGLVFGLVISIFALATGYLERTILLVLVPVFAGLMSGLGGLVAWFTENRLALTPFGKRSRRIIGFFAAAAVNSLIVLGFLGFFSGGAGYRREIFLFVFLGLGMGAIYGIYHYRIDLLSERMRFLEELNEKNRQLEEASRHLAIIAERNRMGRELHDSIAQGLHGITFSLKSLRNEIKNPSPRVEAIVNHLETAAKATLDELRTMIDELKPSLLAEKGLSEALRLTAGMFSQRQQVPVEVRIRTAGRVPPEVEMTVYRVCQEALANIEKHAFARNVEIELAVDETNLFLTIKDDGAGIDLQALSPGNGLINMRSRVEDIGGNFEIVSKTGVGTSIIINLPLL